VIATAASEVASRAAKRLATTPKMGRAALVPFEKHIERALIEAIGLLGLMCEKIRQGGFERRDARARRGRRYLRMGASAGFPDLLVMDLWMLIEVKRPGGRLSSAQKAWHARAAAHGVHVVTVFSVEEGVAAVLARARALGRMPDASSRRSA
jgi:hypothetical protein